MPRHTHTGIAVVLGQPSNDGLATTRGGRAFWRADPQTTPSRSGRLSGSFALPELTANPSKKVACAPGSDGEVGLGLSRRAMGPARCADPFEKSERRNRPVPVGGHCRTLISTGWLVRARTANL